MAQTVGRRIYPDEEGHLWFSPGDYGKDPRDNQWYARPPTSPEDHMTGCLRAHDVTEHPDGTITVHPSILITGHDNDCKVEWHGYLERGVWREV